MMMTEAFSSKAAVDARISIYERKTKSNFVWFKKDKTFGVDDWRNTSHAHKQTLFWKNKYIPYDGTPFLNLGTKVLGCHQGRLTYQLGSEKTDKPKITKKVGCPAKIHIHHVIKFPDFSVDNMGPNCKLKSSQRRERRQLKRLREALMLNPDIQTETVYYLALPSLSDHSGHSTDGIAAGRREKVDPLIKQEVMNLTRDGVCKLNEMKRHINTFVKNVFDEEEVKDTSRRRFHPLDKDILNIMDRTKKLMHHAKENHQEKVVYVMEDWQGAAPETFDYTHAKIKTDHTEKHEIVEAVEEPLTVLAETSDVEERYVNLPPQTKSRRHMLRHKCIGLLKQIIESVHQLKDIDYLEDLYNDLHCKLAEVQLKTPFEVVIHVGSPQKRKSGMDGGVAAKRKRT